MNMARKAGCVVALATLAILAPPASAQETTLLGANLFGTQVPGGGAGREAFADFNGELDPAAGTLCYYFEMEGLEDATEAHIHRGDEGEAGEAVLTLAVPVPEVDEICLDLEPALLSAMVAEPAEFYIDIHSADHRDGALRGQFGG